MYSCCQNEMYLTPDVDKNELESINGPAYVMSEDAFNNKYPTGKIPKRAKEFGKTFVCRRGVDPRRAKYTDKFNWEDISHSNEDEMEQLVRRMEIETGSKQKKAPAVKRKKVENDFKVGRIVEDDDEDQVSTPRKKQKTSHLLTPRKPRTPSKLTPSHKRYGHIHISRVPC